MCRTQERPRPSARCPPARARPRPAPRHRGVDRAIRWRPNARPPVAARRVAGPRARRRPAPRPAGSGPAAPRVVGVEREVGERLREQRSMWSSRRTRSPNRVEPGSPGRGAGGARNPRVQIPDRPTGPPGGATSPVVADGEARVIGRSVGLVGAAAHQHAPRGDDVAPPEHVGDEAAGRRARPLSGAARSRPAGCRAHR